MCKYMAICPKCKSNAVSYINRRTGSSGIGFSVSGTRFNSRSYNRKTFGVCSACGYTFEQTKARARNEANRIKKEERKQKWKSMSPAKKALRIFLYIVLLFVLLVLLTTGKK